MTDKPLIRFFLVLIVAISLAGAWLLGQRQGARDAFALASTQLSSAQAHSMIEQLQMTLGDTEQDLAQMADAVEAGVARTESLRRLLDEQMRENASDAADLALYRKIESSQKARSVDIESLAWSAAQPASLQLTLIQWQGRDRITGQLELSFEYAGDVSTGVAENDESGPDSDKLTVDLKPASFDFRFFQTLTIAMPTDLSGTGSGKSQIPLPQYVNVRIAPAEERLKATVIRFPWSDVAQ